MSGSLHSIGVQRRDAGGTDAEYSASWVSLPA